MGGVEVVISDVGEPNFSRRVRMVCMCMLPGARGAQRRRSQPAFIIVMVMKLVSVTEPDAFNPSRFSLMTQRDLLVMKLFRD